MSNQPNLPRSEYLGYVPMEEAPGADISLDDLFPPEGMVSAQPQAAAQGTNPPEPPQAPQENQPFLKAGSTVYLTQEEAARGLEYKDQLVDRYRTFLKENGYDPNKLQKVEPEPQAQPAQSQSPFTYYGNGNKVYEDFARAVAEKNPAKYEQVLQRYTQEAINAELSPYAPLLAEVARQRAIRRVNEQVPDFQQFVTSQDFQQVQDRLPLLRDAILKSESNPAAADQLDQLYQLSYLVNRGLKSGSNAPQAQPQAQPPTVRTTTPAATLTPPPPGAAFSANEWSTNRDARKQLIKDRDQRGIQDIDWNKVGL